MRSKQLQEVIHLLVRLIEPKIEPQSSPESLIFFETDQACLKPGYLYVFNSSFARIANRNGSLIDSVNFSRISEDKYLEVKMLKEELKIDEEIKN